MIDHVECFRKTGVEIDLPYLVKKSSFQFNFPLASTKRVKHGIEPHLLLIHSMSSSDSSSEMYLKDLFRMTLLASR
jgi:hypothetical protein